MIRRGLLIALGAVAVAGVVAPAASAQVVAAKNFAQLLGEAEQILVGSVTDARPRREPSGLIVTDVTLAVERALKGHVPDPFVLLLVGGAMDDTVVRVRGMPRLEVGRRYVLFVAGNRRTVIPLVGGAQGLFEVVPAPSGGADLVRSAAGGALGDTMSLATFLEAIEAGLR